MVVKNLKIEISRDNIKIIDSYKIKSKSEMKEILKEIEFEDIFHDLRDRTIDDYILEWRSHNLMYLLPLKYFKEHCKDVDLNNNESSFRLKIYRVLGRL